MKQIILRLLGLLALIGASYGLARLLVSAWSLGDAMRPIPFRFVITPAKRCSGQPLAGNGICSVPMQTAATTSREGEESQVPVGSTIFIPELGMKILINDIALSDDPPRIDLYTGTVNNYDHERPNGTTI